jgi:hypothetical protein
VSGLCCGFEFGDFEPGHLKHCLHGFRVFDEVGELRAWTSSRRLPAASGNRTTKETASLNLKCGPPLRGGEGLGFQLKGDVSERAVGSRC